MSFFARPTVVGAILFGCFAVIIPRIFLPFFRPKPSHHVDDREYSYLINANSIIDPL
jgi:hypothetical protein